jgi:glutathione S-transferase
VQEDLKDAEDDYIDRRESQLTSAVPHILYIGLLAARTNMSKMLLQPTFPFLLYSYPWMPYPRVVGIYLREKRIPESLVKVVHVSDPQLGDAVVDSASFPPRPKGSLPVLAIHHSAEAEKDVTYIRQSSSIINFLDDLCDAGQWGFPKSAYSMRGSKDDMVERARITEIRTLAEECLVTWNPVRTFGSGAGVKDLHNAAMSKEMAKWTKRPLTAVERWWKEGKRDVESLKEGGEGKVTMADVVLYQFLEFVRTCYGIDLLVSTGENSQDVYGRKQEEGFEKLRAFMAAMDTRSSVARRAEYGEVPGSMALQAMSTWIDGIWKDEERVNPTSG